MKGTTVPRELPIAGARRHSRWLWRALLLCLLPALLAPPAPAAYGQSDAICTVIANTLNLRSGPGSNFNSLDVLTRGTQVTPLELTTSSWLKVAVAGAPERTGWVRHFSEYISCQGMVAGGVGGTYRIIQPPPATDEGFELIPLPPSEAPGGEVSFDPEMAPLIFEELLSLGADIEMSQLFPLDRVTFTVLDDAGAGGLNAFNRVFARTDASDGYCLFGGETQCSVLPLRAGAMWPGTGIPVQNGSYTVIIELYTEASRPSDQPDEIWRVPVIIAAPALEAAAGP